MLTYMCKNCGRFTITPLTNEFNEYFCSKECYKKYCEKYNYTIHLNKLKKV